MTKGASSEEDEIVSGRLMDLLLMISHSAGPRFTGIGIIVCDNPRSLPIMPLRLAQPDLKDVDAVTLLSAISRPHSDYHDGFHILSAMFAPVLLAQYFSPPIVHGLPIDRSRRFGGRYVAALYGSMLPDVLLTGVASLDFGRAVFKRGCEVLFDRAS
ncbi:MAG: hypothetical protein J0I80_08270 [Sphingomonas sp.]|nr:hypothetical protein [Sphingomonas sp.]